MTLLPTDPEKMSEIVNIYNNCSKHKQLLNFNIEKPTFLILLCIIICNVETHGITLLQKIDKEGSGGPEHVMYDKNSVMHPKKHIHEDKKVGEISSKQI